MSIFQTKITALFLATLLFASGCVSSTLYEPTRKQVVANVKEGDEVVLTPKGGQPRKVQVTGIRADELRLGYDGGIRYEDISEMKVNHAPNNDVVQKVVLIVVFAPLYVAAIAVYAYGVVHSGGGFAD